MATNSTDIFNIVSLVVFLMPFNQYGSIASWDLTAWCVPCAQHRHADNNNWDTSFDFTPENYERVRTLCK